ncbi:ribonuclease HI [Streptomyces silvensis]|uniref:Ribonuclease H n=3 Tax=Streptomyces TaxID=1883 RepID=A0A0W7WWE1_9ACTN|nr:MULTISPECIES: ribonuclease H [Streptomyces]KUF14918.1 ribonuclease HI [Streptomyces silvensis]MVO88614.1 ribonuclease HI [Streptomyces typhae]
MIEDMTKQLIAACDGASKGNPGPAAWAWVLADTDGVPVRWEAGPLGVATNNVAELTALHELLDAVEPGVPVQVRMDSQYAMKAVTEWLPGWKRKGWKTASGKPVANRELVEAIDERLQGRTVEFVYVPAHQVDGDPLNAIADHAASQAAQSQEPDGTAHGASGVPDVPAQTATRSGAARQSRPAARSGSGRARSGSRTISAKFRGTCGGCGRTYAAGDKIAKNAQGWGHPECASA